MPPVGRLLPTGVGAPEDAITPIIGTMLVFVIIFGGMAGALIFGVPSIKGLQDRAAVDDMATQLQAVRREAERLTAEGAGSSVALAPSQGSINLEEGTRMAVAISYDGSAEQQGLALAWGKGGKKKALSSPEIKLCDFHLQDWADNDATVTLVAKDCYEPVRWDPADAAVAPTTQTLTVSSVFSTTDWTDATQEALLDSDDLRATFASNNPTTANDLLVEVTDPTTSLGTISSVLVKAELSVTGSTNPNDGFYPKVCLAGGSCTTANQRAGDQASDTTISYSASRPGGGTWTWDDIRNLQPGFELAQTGQIDGTWRVDRIWVEVNSGGTSSGPSTATCYNTNGAACLQAFQISDPAGVNRITAIEPVSGQADTYLLTLNALLTGDWYFQLSKNPVDPATDQLLAKSYIFGMHRLRWVRDQGLATWLEGGAVFATRGDTHYLHGAPIIMENIADTDGTAPTLYVRIIRFQGDQTSIGGTGTTQVNLRHVGTQSTSNDGVNMMRFDFAGEAAELWCNALMRRDTPTGFAYAEHDFDPGSSADRCEAGDDGGVRSVRYSMNLACTPIPSCLQDRARMFQVTFTEVHFDVTLRP